MKLGRQIISGFVVVMAMVTVSFSSPAFAGEAKEPTKKAAEVKSSDFVASSEGDTYHVAGCSMAKRIKKENMVKFASKADAIKAGYSNPCKVCNKN